MMSKSKIRNKFLGLWKNTFPDGELKNETFRNALSVLSEGYNPPKEIVDQLWGTSPRDIWFWESALKLLEIYRSLVSGEPKEARFLAPDVSLETQLLQEYRALANEVDRLYDDRRTSFGTRWEAAHKKDIAFHRWDVAHHIVHYELDVEANPMSKVELTALPYAKLKAIYENDHRSSRLPLNIVSPLNSSRAAIVDRLYRDFQLFADFPTILKQSEI